MTRFWRRLLGWSLAMMVTLVVAVIAWLSFASRGSLPLLEGHLAGQPVTRPVALERDALGTLTVAGAKRTDVAFGLGFAHAQDRFFQMDLMRRAAAGELSALLGRGTLNVDRQNRLHRFRSVALSAVAALNADHRAILEAYAAGVNAGLRSLRVRPFEYLLLQADPAPWRPEDSLLVVVAMFLQLQEPDGHTKIQRDLVFRSLPAPAARFIYAAAAEWDSALDGTASDAPVLPSPEEFDLRKVSAPGETAPVRHARTRPLTGSNNWAIAGARTATGAALVANDMHLGLRVPNTWYHAQVRLEGGPIVTGVTLPGAPLVVAGSNGHLAWGFTNSYGDFQDVVVAIPDPANADRYQTTEGSEAFTHVLERIEIKGEGADTLDVVGTRWGPVVAHDELGRALALQWTAHAPEAFNLALIGLESATDVTEALQVATSAGIPVQNFVVGDQSGRIGWTLAGQIPRHHGMSSAVLRQSTDPDAGFDGWLPPQDRPKILDPTEGQIVTANARVVGGHSLDLIGDGGYDRGARTRQIKEDLSRAGNRQRTADSLAVQLDERALFLERWHALLGDILTEDAIRQHPRRAEFAATLSRWSGHAAIDDPAYRLVRGFRLEVERRVFDALVAPAAARSSDFHFRVPSSFEGPLWLLVTTRPIHLLPPGHESWEAFFLSAIDAEIATLDTECPVLAACTWGKGNQVRIRHPLSRAVPLLSRFLDIPPEMLPGDEDMPRPQGPAFGASERFAVSPGREAEAYLELPTGQSGHPLSPYFRAGHEAWARGQMAPFLPGVAEHRLSLEP